MSNSTQLNSKPIPDLGSVYGFGWNQMKKYFLELLLLAFIGAFIQIPLGWPYGGDFENWQDYVSFTDRIFPLAYWILVATPLEYGITLMYLKAVRGEKFEFREIITGFNQFVDVILARILVTGIVAIGIFMLIIPGIVFAVKLSLVPYLVMDKKLDAISAVKESWRITEGHAWTIFGIFLLAIPIFIGGLILFIVGVIIAVIWVECTMASMYFAITGRPESDGKPPTPEMDSLSSPGSEQE